MCAVWVYMRVCVCSVGVRECVHVYVHVYVRVYVRVHTCTCLLDLP